MKNILTTLLLASGIILIILAIISYWGTFSLFGKIILVLGYSLVVVSFGIKWVFKLRNGN